MIHLFWNCRGLAGHGSSGPTRGNSEVQTLHDLSFINKDERS